MIISKLFKKKNEISSSSFSQIHLLLTIFLYFKCKLYTYVTNKWWYDLKFSITYSKSWRKQNISVWIRFFRSQKYIEVFVTWETGRDFGKCVYSICNIWLMYTKYMFNMSIWWSNIPTFDCIYFSQMQHSSWGLKFLYFL